MYYFIVNPHSRSGHGQDIWKKTEEILSTKEISYRVYFTEYTGHATDLARRIAERSVPCTLAVLGGDGTLNEVINGLVQTDFSHVTLGYIPTGSGNDFARGLGLSTDLETCVEAILSPCESTLVDIGLSKTKDASRYFLVSSGIGYDADICHHVMSSPLKKVMNRLRLGKLTYVLIALKLLIQYKPSPVSVRLDKKEVFKFPGFFFAAGMNMKYEGGGVKFCPEAEFNDGLLDICLVGKLPKLKVLTLFPLAFSGRHTNFRGIKMMRGQRIDILGTSLLPVHCDGEIMGFSYCLTMQNSGKQVKVIVR